MQTMADLPLKERDRQAIEAAVALLQSQFPVAQVILYGSKVSDQDTAESDIDLLGSPIIRSLGKNATLLPMLSLILS